MPREKLIFIILALISCLGPVASDIYLPSFPAISYDLHASFASVKFSLAIFMVGFALSPLIYGPLSDGIGRRKPLIVGLILCVIGSVICASAQHISWLIAGRLLQGIGAGGGSSLYRSVLRDMFTAEKLSKYGSYSAMITVSVLSFAPLLGGYFQHYSSWRATFIFLSGYALLGLVAVFFIVPETNTHLHRNNLRIAMLKHNVLLLITSRIFIGYSLLNFLTYAAIFSWLTTAPIVLEQTTGITPVDFGWAYTITGVGFFLGALTNSRILLRFGAQKMLRWGLSNMLLAAVLMLSFKLLGFINAFVIVAPAIFLLFGAAFIFPNSFAGAFQPFPKTAGMAGALFGSLGPLGGVAASSVLALAHDQSQVPMGIAMLITNLLAWGVLLFLLRER